MAKAMELGLAPSSPTAWYISKSQILTLILYAHHCVEAGSISKYWPNFPEWFDKTTAGILKIFTAHLW